MAAKTAISSQMILSRSGAVDQLDNSLKCLYAGASRVIAIDRVPERLQMAKDQCKAEVLNYEEVDVGEALKEMTGGRGPDACIDAVEWKHMARVLMHL